MGRTRRFLLGWGIVAGPLVVVSAAYACTTYKGMMTVTASPGTGVSRVLGGNGSHTYCTGGDPERKIATAFQSTTQATPVVVNVEVAPGPVDAGSVSYCNPSVGGNQLPDGTYSIALWNAAGANAAYTGGYTSAWTKTGPSTSCGPANSSSSFFHPLTPLAPMTVQAGSGAAQVVLPSTLVPSTTNSLGLPTDASAICVNQTSGTMGNMAPIAIALI